MEWDLLPSATQPMELTKSLTQVNRLSGKFGLTLSPGDAAMLVQKQAEALRETGRVEFGGSVLPKLARAFCDSPYIQPPDWADTPAELQRLFYQFKSASDGRLGDGTLISAMVSRFNGAAGGSLEALADLACRPDETEVWQ